MRQALSALAISFLVMPLVAQQSAALTETGRARATPPGGGQSPNAAVASYSLLGDNCGTACVSLNNGGGVLNTQTLPNEYCYGVKFPNPTVLVGFQLHTISPVAPVATMTCGVYRESAVPGMPDLNPVATGSMTVTNKAEWYTCRLTKPVIIKAGEALWFSQYDSTNILAASLSSGKSPTLSTYWRRPPGGGTPWAVTGIVQYPAWRALCGNNLAFFNDGVPKLGGSMKLMIQGGPASAPAAVFFGVKNPSLKIGMCTSLYSSGEVAVTVPTNNGGGATFTLKIPNAAYMDGAVFHNQWWMLSKSGVSGSSGGMGTVGQ